MIAHQLDLFGGPLKPPKKIKVDDDDVPADEIKETAPVVSEPGSTATDLTSEENTVIEALPGEPAPFIDDELVTNDIEWSPGYEEIENRINGPANPRVEPFETGPIVAEPGSTATEWTSDETTVTEVLPGKTGPFLDDDLVTNDLEWSPGYHEIENIDNRFNGPELQGTKVELLPDLAATPAEEMELIPTEEEEQVFTDEAIFTAEISDQEVATAELPEAGTSHHNEPFENEAVSTVEPVVVSKLKKVEEEDGLNIPPDEELFKRQYYSMRETSSMFGVNQSLLRFWENEFDILQPKKNKKGDRYFRPVDIKNLVLIYHLLRVRKFTLEGAKDYLNSHKKAADSFELVKRLEKLKSFLFELKAGL